MSLHSEVAEVAFQLYEKGGRVQGHDLEHWLEAEKIVSERDYVREQPSQEGQEKKKAQPQRTASTSRKEGNRQSKTPGPKVTQHEEKRIRIHTLS